ncbi:hypothetical protein LTR78_010847 [Recurvomyces mirabilis]|uniref:YTH domain-containing protein n=1 Tax=Recurvomyces mirabilis TaxID=574656 RepID=A0AAE0TPP8_9PEZI|nr:hypothetical protein LTR78_010847 [Recurvomyces mirabilis]KAK5150340.1 hypothetical protein LTS14_010179 [Recurvomyces mirabilis]
MSAVGSALPNRAQYEPGGHNDPSLALVFHMHHASQYKDQSGSQMHPTALQAQSQQSFHPRYQMRPLVDEWLQGPNLLTQLQYQRTNMLNYGVSVTHYSPFDTRSGPSVFAAGGGGGPDFGNHVAQRASGPALVPSLPRGPPRKPKQSGHALWVGNLPPAATVNDLKDHFSRDATRDIESVFLIAKSNCAFVNYRTEAACEAAVNRFHDSRLHGVRLACRLRRGSTIISKASSPTPSSGISNGTSAALPDVLEGPVIVGGGSMTESELVSSEHSRSPTAHKKVPEKYFIIKSLTVEDLEASVRNGTWATQSHNEDCLNHAYEVAENVYLIFSANKSGEYFGYARMSSTISGKPVNLGALRETEEAKTDGTPRSIATPATKTAPRGRIIDDSARGTIFWEADSSDTEPDALVKEWSEEGCGHHWRRQFNIEWISTARLPFFRTRGLRNPWNANREVKIARDGTELEPGVGRTLVGMFHMLLPAAQRGAIVVSSALMPS